MKKIFWVIFVLFTFIFTNVYAHDKQHGHSDHEKEESHGLGVQVFKGKSKGIEVKAYLNDIESAMKAMAKDSNIKIDKSKMDPNLTHHISVKISDSIQSGKVKLATLKLTFKDNTKTYKLFSMHGHYGSDISLKEKGTYNAQLLVETEKSGNVEFNFQINLK
jgi:hypothetical protein